MVLFRVEIVCDDATEVRGKKRTARMIPFHGTVEGECFHGIVLPGGIDTQMQEENGETHLSARYILEGVDEAGAACRIFVENQGKSALDSGVIRTIPKMVTDSPSLQWLETAEIYGEVKGDGEKVIITFYLSR